MIDSGTTFTYLSGPQIQEIAKHMKEICFEGNYTKKCLATHVSSSPICYRPNRVNGFTMKDFFNSFPVIKYNLPDGQTIKWFPSEYFYEDQKDLF
jgi:hypothetical protein